MLTQKYKRLLIISHNCLSKTGSNGRTLRNYLLGWPKEKIAQLYIHPETPDFDVCENYFCINDSNIMLSIIKRTAAGNKIDSNVQINNWSNSNSSPKRKKNSILFLLREVAWNSKLWNSCRLNEWLDNYQPEAILFQAGDAGFLFRLTYNIAEHFSVPVILYNTEGYYFKKKSHLKDNSITALFYPLWHHYFCCQYRKLIKKAALSIYNCDMLADDYQKAFHHKSEVIMNSSEFTDRELNGDIEQTHHIVYAGNVEVGRHESIIAFAEEAHRLDGKMYVDVYANVKDEKIKQKLEQCQGVRLHGFIPYNELQQIIQRAEYLLHVENFAPFYCEDLKYAFSTKIADSLATGNCLIVYAPANIAVCQYLTGRDAAILISNKDDLPSKLEQILNDHVMRKNVRENGRKLALQNHSINQNRMRFQEKLSEVICDEGTSD